MFRDDSIEIIMHGVNAEEEYLSQIKSLNDEIHLFKYERKFTK